MLVKHIQQWTGLEIRECNLQNEFSHAYMNLQSIYAPY